MLLHERNSVIFKLGRRQVRGHFETVHLHQQTIAGEPHRDEIRINPGLTKGGIFPHCHDFSIRRNAMSQRWEPVDNRTTDADDVAYDRYAFCERS